MAWQRCCGLLLLASLGLLLGAAIADVRYTSTRPGLFYVFMSGQIVVINPITGTVVKSIRAMNQTAAQIPNSCPGSPLQGTWNGLELGLRGHTIFASFAFAAQGSMRQSGLSDGVAVINCTSQEIEKIIPVDGQPSSITAVPQDETMWVHTDNNGAYTVLSISPEYDVQEVNLGASTNAAVAGNMVSDTAMGTKGYMTSFASSGIYVYDMFARTGASFINFQTFRVARHSWLKQRGVYCPATSHAVYAPASRRVFVACTRALAAAGGVVTRGTNPGIVEVSVDTDLPADAWPHIRADRLYLTPDESLVVAVDEVTATINLLQPLPGINSDQTMTALWPNITLPEGSHPDQIVFRPSGSYFKAFVSLLKSTYTAVIDFAQIIPCGIACPPDTVQAAVELINTGFQIAPRAVASTVNSRPIAAGDHFVCVDMASNATLHCHNLENPAQSRMYRNMANIDQIIFVEGPYDGDEKLIPVYTSGKGVNTTFACGSQ